MTRQKGDHPAEGLRKHGIGDPFEDSAGGVVSGNGRFARWLRRWVRFRYLSMIERVATPGSRLLEFGCGGGDAWLAKEYDVTGLEVSEASAKAARALYPQVIVADVAAIPIRDGSFDVATSIFVLEHLSSAAAKKSLEELSRVLVSGGLLVCVCDLECDHPMLSFIRRHYPLGYNEAYIDVPGHFGLRREEEWRHLVGSAGFHIEEWNLQSRLPLLDYGPLVQLSTSRHIPRVVRAVGLISLWFSKLPRIGPVWALTVTVIDRGLRFMLPERWAYRLAFVARRD